MRTLEDARRNIDRIDEDMLRLFEERMVLSREIACIKEKNGLPIQDCARERERLENSASSATDKTLSSFCVRFQKDLMLLSRSAQKDVRYRTDDTLTILHKEGIYPARIQDGIIDHVNDFFDLTGRILIVTDDGVPHLYIESLKRQYPHALVYVMPAGEDNKTIHQIITICKTMTDACFDRSDAIIALGGGVVCDVAGFAAAVYKRGINCCLIPSTLLAQTDAAIGGKTAVNFEDIKNAMGVIKAPKAVAVDPFLLHTLHPRHLTAGMAECFKVALCFDRSLFYDLALWQARTPLSASLIRRVIDIKRRIVETDEEDESLRHTLNFGHTIGHAIEAACGGSLLHGECVAIGILAMSKPSVQKVLFPLFSAWGLPCSCPVQTIELIPYLRQDKKAEGTKFHTIQCENIGSYIMAEEEIGDLVRHLQDLSLFAASHSVDPERTKG